MAKELVQSDPFGDIQNYMMPLVTLVLIAVMLPTIQSAQRYYESQYYEGQSDPKTLHATHTPKHIVLTAPWIGAYFINDGPNGVEVKINGVDSQSFVINPGETVTINRAGARDRIYAIYYVCHGGGTATLRVIGEY